jgi:arsenate reductase (thioredoxin)
MAPLKLLFICTHNRCRSILAEAIANYVGAGLLQAASGGSEPAGAIHPLTLQSLERHHVPTTGLYSKSWDGLEDFQPDFVITVCDKAAAEPCPLWFGRALQVHWGLQDPSALDDPEAGRHAFDQTIQMLSTRLGWIRQGLEQGLNQQALTMLIRALADTCAAVQTEAADTQS